MLRAKKSLLSLAVAFAVICSILLTQAGVARASKGGSIYCVVDVVVESKTSSGVVASREVYQKEFVLQEGGVFSDDFSTRTRFKFFDASLQTNDGEKTVAISWFADVTVFNSVDLNTTVILADGQKSGKSAGNHTLYTSSGYTTTTYSLSCIEN